MAWKAEASMRKALDVSMVGGLIYSCGIINVCAFLFYTRKNVCGLQWNSIHNYIYVCNIDMV